MGAEGGGSFHVLFVNTLVRLGYWVARVLQGFGTSGLGPLKGVRH